MIRGTSFTLLAALGAAGLAAPAPATAQARRYSADSSRAQKLVDKAASVVIEMSRDPKLYALMRQAAGLYIIPEYGRAGFIIGGKGGAGVVVARDRRGQWGAPAFVNTGGLNVGLQIGAGGGSITYLLMDRRAVDAFRNRNKFSLTANAGLSVVTYSAAAQANTQRGDAILWTNIRGAYAGATVGATDVGVDGDRTREFYGRDVGVDALLDGRVSAPGARALDRVLPR